jgi:hypothetical protein
LALADTLEQVGSKRYQVAPRVFLDFLPGQPLEIEIGGKKEAGLAEKNFNQLAGVEIFPSFIMVK